MTTELEPVRGDDKAALPDGWRWVRLGEICAINPPRPPDLNRPEGAPTSFVPMAAVDERLGAISKAEIRPFAQLRRGYTYFEEGDVLFAKITPCMQNGKHAIARGLIDGFGFGTTEFHVLRPGGETIPEWIHFFLRQPRILREATAHFTGAVGQQRVPEGFLANLDIPLPSLREQQRIAAVLMERMAAVERARAAAHARLEAARALPAAYLRAIFASTDKQRWPRRPLGDVCRLLPSKSIASDGDVEVRAITTAALSETGFLPAGVKTARMWPGDVPECVVSPGEILVARSNTPELVGRAAMFTGDPPGAVASDLTIRIAAGDQVDPAFAAAFLSFLYVSGYWRDRAGGASGSMKKITRRQIGDQWLPVPPRSEQARVAALLSAQMVAAERARQAVEAELAAIERLPGAILRRAFFREL